MLRTKVSVAAVLSLITFLQAACLDNDAITPLESLVAQSDVQTSSERAQRIAQEMITKSVQGDDSRGIENTILRMEAEVPSIGGMYTDAATGRTVVIVTKASDGIAAIAIVRRLFLDRIIGTLVQGLDRLLSIIIDVVDVKLGDFPFSMLVAWHEILIPDLFRKVPATISIDADERTNRVDITVEDLSVQPQIEAILEANGVPLRAVTIREGVRPRIAVGRAPDNSSIAADADAAATRTHTLSSTQPIMGAGLEIYNGKDGGICTQGFTAETDGTWGYFTAAHCSHPIGAGEIGAEFYQPSPYTYPAWNFGWVWRNQPFDYSSSCESYSGRESDLCTRADIMYLATNPEHRANSPEPGNLLGELRVAWTTDVGRDDRPGSTTIDEWFGIWRGDPIYNVGSTAMKTGRATGTTQGYVTSTSASVAYCSSPTSISCEPYTIVLYAVGVDGASSGHGDSGAPVFALWQWNGDLKAMPFGILFAGSAGTRDGDGRCTDNCAFWFSPLAQARGHLGRPFNVSDDDWPGW